MEYLEDYRASIAEECRARTSYNPAHELMCAVSTDSGAEQFLAHLEMVERVVAFVCRRHHLRPEDADDFSSYVKLKLVENDYAVFTKFKGRSSVRTYLTVVIQRFFLDYRRAAWGTWRPSAEAKRLGPVAMLMERLLTRDGYSIAEACEVVQTNHRVRASHKELERLALRLPTRTKRRFESESALVQVASAEPTADDLAAEQDQARVATLTSGALTRALTALDPQDRLILALRFEDGRTVADIADLLRVDRKPLYRRIDRLLKGLRESLESQGIDSGAVLEMLESQAVSVDWRGNVETEGEQEGERAGQKEGGRERRQEPERESGRESGRSGPSSSKGGAEWR